MASRMPHSSRGPRRQVFVAGVEAGPPARSCAVIRWLEWNHLSTPKQSPFPKQMSS